MQMLLKPASNNYDLDTSNKRKIELSQKKKIIKNQTWKNHQQN